MKKILIATSLFMFAHAQAMNFDWNGSYRFEFNDIDRPSLTTPGMKKTYMLNHLSLMPKIIAADGIRVVANVEVLPNATYAGSQMGVNLGSQSRASASSSAAVSTNQSSSTIAVNQLYLIAQQEYGSLLAGRAPLEFGLGISHNAGNGIFDHWHTNRDLVGYKFIVGNFHLMPIVGKVYDAAFENSPEISDLIWDIGYSNPETESAIGVFWQQRSSGDKNVNDAAQAYGGTSVFGYNVASTNVYLARGFDFVKIKFEAGFNAGGAGLISSTGEDVKVNGYGLVLDLDFPRPASKWQWNVRMGMVSGDNPNTAAYEGFAFDRNYDLAMILFNHPLGQYDALGSTPYRYRTSCAGPGRCPTLALNQTADEEVVANAIFLAPKLEYRFSDRWQMLNSVVWARSHTKAATDADQNLGIEWDLGFVFKPTARVQWLNQFGILFPGAAWKAGTLNYDSNSTIGLRSAIAVSF